MIFRVFAILLVPVWLVACGEGSTPDGNCVDDFDCEPDQVCGLSGICLLCDNCQRGIVGSCTVPAYPQPRAPDSIWRESLGDRECLHYIYRCEGNLTDYRYDRLTGARCFEREPGRVEDGCGLE
jgi:hypothetical protein